MAEYKSFHYLMHNVPEAIKPEYVNGPSELSFSELYTPRETDEAGKLISAVLVPFGIHGIASSLVCMKIAVRCS